MDLPNNSDVSNSLHARSVLHWNYRGYKEFPDEILDEDQSSIITDIYLKENFISRIPKEICRLDCLQSLYLSGNSLRCLPKEIGCLTTLKCLDLSGNQLTTLPGEVGDLRRLKHLILDDNELVEIPLRLRDLKMLRYLSICDNQLMWLPQRPMHNYYHCEFRFWRNRGLRHLPLALWRHVFAANQIRGCYSIGCLNVYQNEIKALDIRPQSLLRCHCILKMHSYETERKIEIAFPRKYQQLNGSSPPTLHELCLRIFHTSLSRNIDEAIGKTTNLLRPCFIEKIPHIDDVFNLQQFGIPNEVLTDNGSQFNGENNKQTVTMNSSYSEKDNLKTVSDLVESQYRYLPWAMKQELRNGPISNCENTKCKLPMFEFAVLEFTMGNIQVMDNTEEILLSALFCSKSCVEEWKRSYNMKTLSWEQID